MLVMWLYLLPFIYLLHNSEVAESSFFKILVRCFWINNIIHDHTAVYVNMVFQIFEQFNFFNKWWYVFLSRGMMRTPCRKGIMKISWKELLETPWTVVNSQRELVNSHQKKDKTHSLNLSWKGDNWTVENLRGRRADEEQKRRLLTVWHHFM